MGRQCGDTQPGQRLEPARTRQRPRLRHGDTARGGRVGLPHNPPGRRGDSADYHDLCAGFPRPLSGYGEQHRQSPGLRTRAGRPARHTHHRMAHRARFRAAVRQGRPHQPMARRQLRRLAGDSLHSSRPRSGIRHQRRRVRAAGTLNTAAHAAQAPRRRAHDRGRTLRPCRTARHR